MTTYQLSLAKRYAAKGISRRDAAALLKVPMSELKNYHPANELQACAMRLMKSVPNWWRGTSDEWLNVVHNNFCDVLETN